MQFQHEQLVNKRPHKQLVRKHDAKAFDLMKVSIFV